MFQPGEDQELHCSTSPKSSLISCLPPPCLPLEPEILTEQDYIDLAVTNADLKDWEKAGLRHLLESKPDLRTMKPGKTSVLQHSIQYQYLFSTFETKTLLNFDAETIHYRTIPERDAGGWNNRTLILWSGLTCGSRSEEGRWVELLHWLQKAKCCNFALLAQQRPPLSLTRDSSSLKSCLLG